MADEAAENGTNRDDSAEAEAPPQSDDSTEAATPPQSDDSAEAEAPPQSEDSTETATPPDSGGLDLDAERDRLDKVEVKIEEGRRALADAEDEPETGGPPVAAGEGAANAPPG